MSRFLGRFYENCLHFGDSPCLWAKEGGKWQPVSWTTLLDSVLRLISWLKKEGIQKGDYVAVYANTCLEWTLIDLAVISMGAVTVPVYSTLSSGQVSYILNHSRSKIIFVGEESCAKKLENLDIPHIRKIVTFKKEKPGHQSLPVILETARPEGSFKNLMEGVSEGDIATCVYTSGTTGEMKGALITHGNIEGEVLGLMNVFDFGKDDIGLLFLPLAHVIARAMQFYQLASGCQTAYAESLEKIPENILEIRPHFMAVVPRIIEKIYNKIDERLKGASSIKRALFKRSIATGMLYSRAIRQGMRVKCALHLEYWMANTFIFSILKKRLGGRIKYIISGGAPLDKSLIEFFHAVGILIVEGYGLTETLAAVTINRPDDFKFGTVGKPLAGVQMMLSDEGEILVKGPQVFSGYKEPAIKEETPSLDGEWFRTGDLGEFSKEGFLRIIGRKKEIIVTSGGKNISPQMVENMIKRSPYISDAVVVGDRKKYLSALITLNKDKVLELGLADQSAINALIAKEIESANNDLSKHETIKKFVIIDRDFSQENGEMTPTMKLKRQIICEKYNDMIEKMYDE